KSNRGGRAIGHSIAPIPPARYPSIPNKHVIFFHTLMSEIVPDNIIFLTPLFFFRLLQLESAAEDRIGTAATRRQALQLVRAEIARLAEAVVHPGQIHGSRVAVEIHIVPKFAGTRAGRRPVKRLQPDGTNTPVHNVKTNSYTGARQHSVHV